MVPYCTGIGRVPFGAMAARLMYPVMLAACVSASQNPECRGENLVICDYNSHCKTKDETA